MITTFALIGNRDSLYPIAASMGLLQVRDYVHRNHFGAVIDDDVKYVRQYGPKTKYKMRMKGCFDPNAVVPHTRGYDHGGNYDESKAVEYAEFLARRDKIRLPEEVSPIVEFENVKLAGYKRPIKRAKRVHFGEIVINIPHVHYDPTIIPQAQ